MRHVTVIKWIARVVGTVLTLLLAVLFFSDGLPIFLFATDPLHMIALGAMVVGLVVAWRWEGVGSALILGGYLVDLVTVNVRFGTFTLNMGPIVTIVPLVGIAFAYVAWRKRGARPPQQPLAR